MITCRRNRKRITLLALGELDAPRAQDLRTHLETCHACRCRFEEISNITDQLAAADVTRETTVSPSFHHRVLARLRHDVAIPARAQRIPALRDLVAISWRPAMATCLVLLTTILFWSILRPTPASHGQIQFASAPRTLEPVPAPTMSNYRRAANRSFDDLDALLTRQARESSPAAPLYTASTTSP